MNKIFFSLLMIALLFSQCKNESTSNSQAEEAQIIPIIETDFGSIPDEKPVKLYTLKNGNGMEVDITNYGGIITRMTAPDKEGKYDDVVLGYSTLEAYQASNPYFGALIGRYGNRIADAKFTIDGEEYTLEANDGKNHLHGGVKGYDKVVWEVTDQSSDENGAYLTLHYLSPDMEGGYPGNLDITVKYTLNNDDEIVVDYMATTDKKTVVNLTQHSYFNLSGDMSTTILDHEVMINADQYLPVDETLIPTGELRAVEGTPFDFTEPKAIGKEIEADNEQIKRGKGYDHCWVLNDQDSGKRLVASVYHPGTGRYMEVYSDEPAIQFYTGNFLDGTLNRKDEGTYAYRSGFCLETQHYPDSPNQPEFPSVLLAPGETYKTTTSYKFSAK